MTTQSMSLSRLDSLIARLLFVSPQASAQPVATEQMPVSKRAERAFTWSLAMSALRCVIKYIVFPFVLPVIGISGGLATGLTLLINLVAISSLILTTRRLWQINYKRKWAYLTVALGTLLFLLAFIAIDITRA